MGPLLFPSWGALPGASGCGNGVGPTLKMSWNLPFGSILVHHVHHHQKRWRNESSLWLWSATLSIEKPRVWTLLPSIHDMWKTLFHSCSNLPIRTASVGRLLMNLWAGSSKPTSYKSVGRVLPKNRRLGYYYIMTFTRSQDLLVSGLLHISIWDVFQLPADQDRVDGAAFFERKRTAWPQSYANCGFSAGLALWLRWSWLIPFATTRHMRSLGEHFSFCWGLQVEKGRRTW